MTARPQILNTLRSTGESISLVAGLTWKRIVSASDDPDAWCRSTANQAKSNFMLIGRDQDSNYARILGHGQLEKSTAPLYSLAFAFQLQIEAHEKALIANCLDDGRVWVCAVSDGLICHDYDVVLSEAEAEEKCKAFGNLNSESRDKISIYGDFIKDSRSMSLRDLADFISGHADEQCRLQEVGKKVAIPRWAIYAGVLVLLGLVTKTVWEEYDARQKEKARALAEVEQDPGLPLPEVWKKSLAQWQEQSNVAEYTSLSDALREIAKLPTSVVGWILEDVGCNRIASTWSCSAEYKRENKHSTSAKFLAALPSDSYKVSWVGLDKASVSFSAETKSAKVDISKLPTFDKIHVPLMSSLQRATKAFASLGDEPKFAAVGVTLIKRPDGSAYVVPPEQMKPLVLNALVSLAGPVRAPFALSEMPISWKSFKLHLKAGDDPSLSVSYINFTELKGEIYAVQE